MSDHTARRTAVPTTRRRATGRTARRAGALLASVLTADALAHLYWTTGYTWPAADDRSLSHAVLGMEAPFTPPVLVPLATLLLTASGVVLAQSRRPHRLLRLGTLAVASGLSLRALAGVCWLFTRDTGSAFYRLNLGLYTPLCVVLCAAALQVAGRPDAAGKADAPGRTGGSRREDGVRVR
ncbi:DUF3995 domain-containing protein [Streptomyces sp. NPDC008313]|uniref:DUF3995 domain-containing protein n=1 Tax=Streptomyces sp. NPDC008313 TaxID=3364826 RepID=UPI0036E4C4E2